jgi:hypothetical protein
MSGDSDNANLEAGFTKLCDVQRRAGSCTVQPKQTLFKPEHWQDDDVRRMKNSHQHVFAKCLRDVPTGTGNP